MRHSVASKYNNKLVKVLRAKSKNHKLRREGENRE